MGERKDILRRYTSLPVLIDMLVRNRLTLIGYSHWVDANDRRALQLYQRTFHYGFVGAMCLTQEAETFHHWHVFAPGEGGVCVVFDRAAFEQLFRDRPYFLARRVEYVKLSDIGDIDAGDIHRLPFLKRHGFKHEGEYRVIGYSVEKREALTVDMPPNLIKRVILSPSAHPTIVESSTAALQSIDGWSSLIVNHSRLTNNQTWQGALERYVDRHGIIYSPWIEMDSPFRIDGASEDEAEPTLVADVQPSR